MSILTAYRDKQEQKQEHFLHYNVHFANPNMLMLTFNVVVLGYQGLLFRYFLCFFLRGFQSDRPTQYHETHLTLKEKKRGGGGGDRWPNLERVNEIYRRSKVPVVSYLCAFLQKFFNILHIMHHICFMRRLISLTCVSSETHNRQAVFSAQNDGCGPRRS